LQAQVEALLAHVYPFVRKQVIDDVGLFHLPEQCPFKAADVLRDDFWPESATLPSLSCGAGGAGGTRG
jgi:hypothetical protein